MDSIFLVTISNTGSADDVFAGAFDDVPPAPTVEAFTDQAAAFARAKELYGSISNGLKRYPTVLEITSHRTVVERPDYPRPDDAA